MQSKQITLETVPSKIPLIPLALLFAGGVLLSRYVPATRYYAFAIFLGYCLFWLYRYLNFKTYTILINTPTFKVFLNDVPATIIKYKHVSWWLSIIYLRETGITRKIYLFADSVPFKTFKTFKIFSQWT